MLFTKIMSSYMLLIGLFLEVNSAPTHHLTIGVDGNTPTLKVTSAELGLTTDLEKHFNVKPTKSRKNFKATEKQKQYKPKNSGTYKKDKSTYSVSLTSTTGIPTGSNTQDTTMGKLTFAMTTPSPNVKAFSPTTETTAASTTIAAAYTTILSNAYQGIYNLTIAQTGSDPDTLIQTTEQIMTTAKSPDDSSAKSIEVEQFSTDNESLTSLVDNRRSSTSEMVEISTSTEYLLDSTTPRDITENSTYYETHHSQSTIDSLLSSLYPFSESNEVTLLPKEAGEETNSEAQSPMPEVTDSASLSTHGLLETSTESLTTTSIKMETQTSTTTTLLPEESTSISTESILKLIDLEQHNTDVIDVGEHDNGHDGLKNIRKKQLIDKHYMDSINHSKEVEILKNGETVNLEIKHGFLGPILMEEKRVHGEELTKKPQHLKAIAAEIHNGYLVELKDRRSKEATITTSALPPLLRSEVSETTAEDWDTQAMEEGSEPSTVLSTTVFQVPDGSATKVPSKSANTMFTSTDDDGDEIHKKHQFGGKIESKISDIQIEVYDSTVDSIVASTNFKDADISAGKSTKPPLPIAQQERFTQYVIDRTETSTQESINFSTIQVASGKPEPAAIEIHINVSESLGNDNEDVDVSFPLSEYNANGHGDEAAYDDVKAPDDIKLKIASNPPATNLSNKDKSDEVLVVEIVDNSENTTESRGRTGKSDELFTTDVKNAYTTPPPPPPPPPFRSNYDRDSDTIFYISNTEVKVGETLPTENKEFDERKMKLENQFFPVNYMASTHPNVNTANNIADHHIYEEDIIVSSRTGTQPDSLKIYRNRNEPSPPLDVTYVGESIIEVEQQGPDSSVTTNTPMDHAITPQPDVIIQPAILPEISIGVPVIGELPPQIELKEIDYMPNEVHRPFGASDEHKLISASSNDVDNHLDESSVQYGGDLIDESADGGFDGVEGSYPFGNPATMTKRKQNDYAHLYINYGVNNMRKDELTADIKDSGEVALILDRKPGDQPEQLNATFKEFLNKIVFNHTASVNDTERNANVTAFSIMEDSMEDKNAEDIISLISLAIGLFIVILPVVVTCSMLWALRYLYKKYHSSSADNNGTVDTVDAKCQSTEDAAEKGEDMSRVARETKMDYNKDGVFVVEVARGVDSKTIPDSPIADESHKVMSMFEPKSNGTMTYKVSNEKITHNNAKVQIHSPPPEKADEGPRSLHQIEEVEEPAHSPRQQESEENDIANNYKSNVGLSQSDLSSTSSNDSNKGYCYGNQELYVVEQPGYSTSSPTGNISLKCDSKDIKDDDRNSENGKNLEIMTERKDETKESENHMSTLNKAADIGSVDDEHVTQQQQEQDISVGESTTNSAEEIPETAKGIDDRPMEECKDVDDIAEKVNNTDKGYIESEMMKKEVTSNEPKKDTTSVERPTEIAFETVNKSDPVEQLEKTDEQNQIKTSKTQNQYTKEEVKRVDNFVEISTNAETTKCDDAIEHATEKNEDKLEKCTSSVINDIENAQMCHSDGNFNSTEPEIQKEHLAPPTEENVDSTNITTMEVSDIRESANINVDNGNIPQDPIKTKHVDEKQNIPANNVAMKDNIKSYVQESDKGPTANGGNENADQNPIELKESLTDSHVGNGIVGEINTNSNQNSGIFSNAIKGHIVDSDPKDDLRNAYLHNDIMPEMIPETKDKTYETVNDNDHINGTQANPTENGVFDKIANGTSHFANGSESLPDLVPVKEVINHANVPEVNGINNSQMEFENGYDSIISLPEPPPNTDEMLCSDLSELQLDSLPPPPPPLVNELNGETFSLKDLPPPLTNAVSEPLASEDMANLCATLPPPPPTTLHVSSSPVMNGNMHASPLTPPASPPPHFTNGLHAGLCPPIAVDVNGS